MYSEHLLADLLALAQGWYVKGTDLDQDLTRVTVELGRLIGPDLGYTPTDASLAWWARRTGTPAPVLTRGAIHLNRDGRTGIGLGPGRGVLETRGDRLVRVRTPEPGRYLAAYRLPTIEYGGLL